MFAPRTLHRLFLATSLLVAVPVLVNTLGCGRPRDASDYDDDDDDDRPRKKHGKKKKSSDSTWGAANDGDGNGGDEGGGKTWYCAPSDVTACFETLSACRERAQYVKGRPQCVTASKVYCYTHDLYLNATYACFSSMRDCAGDQSIAKNQEVQNQGTYYNVSACQRW